MTTVCKTVGFAFPGSNPAPAGPAGTRPSWAQTRLGLLPGRSGRRSGCVRRGPADYGWSGRIRGEVSPAFVLTIGCGEVVNPEAVDRVPPRDVLGVARISTSTACPLTRLLGSGMLRQFARLSTRCQTWLSFRTGNYRYNRPGRIDVLTDTRWSSEPRSSCRRVRIAGAPVMVGWCREIAAALRWRSRQ